MDIRDERTLRKGRPEREDGPRRDLEDAKDFLEENFEDPEHSDILVEKQVKEGKRKKV